MQYKASDGADCSPKYVSFDRMFNTFRDPVFAYLLARTGQRESALDLLQDVFARAWGRPEAWLGEPESSQRYWLFAVAKNAVIDLYRRNTNRLVALSHLKADNLRQQTEASAESQVLREELLGDVQRAIANLPAELRIPLVMQIVGGMNSNEIHEVLGIPAGTVRYRLSMARRRIRAEMEEQDGALEAGVDDRQ